MKTKYPPVAKLPSLLIASIGLAASAASAQTSVYYTSGSGATPPVGATSGGDLASIGFDSYQSNNFGGANSDGGLISAASTSFGEEFWQNYTATGIPSTDALTGGLLQSVTLILFVDSVSPNYAPSNYRVFNGLSGTGGQAFDFVLTTADNEQKYYSLTVDQSVWAGGFSIGGLEPEYFTNFATEENNVPAYTPLVIANYAIPEPSAALLGAMTSLVMLRRRRPR